MWKFEDDAANESYCIHFKHRKYLRIRSFALSRNCSSVLFTCRSEKNLPDGTEIIYLGWVMAGNVKGYAKTAKRYNVSAVCAVGMSGTAEHESNIRAANRIPENIPLFTLQGNFDSKKLRGIYKLLINMVVKNTTKKLSEKSERTDSENDMLELMLHGGKRVSHENLKEVLKWHDSVKIHAGDK